MSVITDIGTTVVQEVRPEAGATDARPEVASPAGQRERWLVMLTGPSRAGKSTVAEMLQEEASGRGWATHCLPLAAGLKRELAMITGVPVEVQEVHRTEWRVIWQVWGTEVRRDWCGEDWWLKKWNLGVQEGFQGGARLFIVPDLRFRQEELWLRDWAVRRGIGSRVVQVARGEYWHWAWNRPHRSEQEWKMVLANAWIKNSGSLEYLRGQVQRVWGELFAPED